MADKDYTDDELDQLTDEEREAIESNDDIIDDGEDDDAGDDTTVNDAKTGEDDDKPAGKEGDDEGGEGETDPDKQDKEGEDDAASAGRDDGKPVESEEDEAKPAAKPQYAPSLRSEVPDDYDDQIKAITDERAALRKQYNEGDIDFDEYDAKRDELDEKRRTLDQIKIKGEISEEMRVDRWLNRDVAGFMADHPEYKEGSALHTMLDREVRILQAKATGEGRDPFDPAFLDQAHANIRESLAKDLGLKADDKPAVIKSKGATPPPKRTVPPTLGNVPAAEIDDPNGGKWASLDRLMESNPAAFEERMEKMSDEERNAYLASQ
ncbi:MAG TPA: hypothetical protein VNQ97_11850 [Burkholderiaceae bacterium]|nr:hypothetical protein [Burkholderiaceae bacterium]